ncbi:hypothetical protein G5C65_07565 [Streptomyces sp. SB3404]|uniref:Uncharacterized protein n=1 Tax=Streptomyces boncukensis TaxID=2711219 RepID=A0A6G4WTN8_9ACTN|nr:hypothetical protein [Streptomyces boncukensis]
MSSVNRRGGGGAGRGSRVLFLAALLLGIVAMHALGPPVAEAGAAAPAAPVALAAPPTPAAAAAAAPAHAEADGRALHPGHGDSRGGEDHSGPLSVCLAVLMLGVAATALVRVALRRGAAPSGALAAVRARVLPVLWPMPPPARRAGERLAELSVLRV